MNLRDALVGAGPLVADGAMGTYGFSSFAELGPVPSVWPLDEPEIVAAMHRAYVDAGARLLVTCTFGASRGWLGMQKRDGDLESLNRAAVAIAREAAHWSALVVGGVGPGAPLAQGSAATDREIGSGWYREQIEVLADAGVDAVLLETMMSIDDVEDALRAADRIPCPVLVSATFNSALQSRDGRSPGEFARVAESLGAAAVGANCCDGPSTTLRAIEAMAAATSLPLIAKPSAGLPDDSGRYPVGSAEFAEWAVRLRNAGARIVGGCCGTGPDYIALLAGAFDRS